MRVWLENEDNIYWSDYITKHETTEVYTTLLSTSSKLKVGQILNAKIDNQPIKVKIMAISGHTVEFKEV